MPEWYNDEPFGAFWERGYRSLNVSCMGGPSFEVAEIAPALPPRAKVIDLGCGEGRNAFYLASLGCDVTAVDRSSAGIQKLNHLANTAGLSIKTSVGDIVDFHFQEEYDLIMAHGVLYYLENPVWRRLLTQAKEKTKAGGFNVFTLFVYTEGYPCVDEIKSASYKHSFAPCELKEFYDDWTQYRYDRYVKWDAHPGIPLHYHPIEKLVAQKPSNSPNLFEIQEIMNPSSIKKFEFDAIPIGISIGELLQHIGQPSEIDRVHFGGIQFGASHGCSSALNDNYLLELWYYGEYVFYIVDGEVTGKALYSTRPRRLRKV